MVRRIFFDQLDAQVETAFNFAAAGGTHDDWDTYDRVMREEGRVAVLVGTLLLVRLPSLVQPMMASFEFAKGEGPVIHEPISNRAQIDKLSRAATGRGRAVRTPGMAAWSAAGVRGAKGLRARRAEGILGERGNGKNHGGNGDKYFPYCPGKN